MALYRLFPSKDATIYSKDAERNSGRDSILEVGYTDKGIARSLIAFDSVELQEVVAKAGSGNFTANLKLTTANASNLESLTTIEAYPISDTWEEGRGHKYDVPMTSENVSWYFGTTNNWWDPTITDLIYGEGGACSGSNLVTDNEITHEAELDIKLNITNYIEEVVKGNVPNEGILLKYKEEDDSITDENFFQFFSRNTNTIYYPYLEVVWDDVNTSSSLEEISDSSCSIKIKQQRAEYTDSGKVRLYLQVRPEHPARVFQTSSLYSTNYTLPIESYWGIEDSFTKEMVVDFDSVGTKIGKDDKGSYLEFYLDNLFIERYYRLIVKTSIDGIDIVQPAENTFKVVANG